MWGCGRGYEGREQGVSEERLARCSDEGQVAEVAGMEGGGYEYTANTRQIVCEFQYAGLGEKTNSCGGSAVRSQMGVPIV